MSPALAVDSLLLSHQGSPREDIFIPCTWYLVPGIVNAQKMIKPMRAQCYFSRRWQQKGLSGKKEEEQAGEPFRMSWVWSAAAKSLQSCPTLCDPIDGSPPGSPVPGILQARTLEWVAISFSNA